MPIPRPKVSFRDIGMTTLKKNLIMASPVLGLWLYGMWYVMVIIPTRKYNKFYSTADPYYILEKLCNAPGREYPALLGCPQNIERLRQNPGKHFNTMGELID